MNESPNSQTATSNEPIEPMDPPELSADLSQNLDEVNDMQLALAALGGLRATTANDASEASHRRYDDRNHRLHETRMKETFGMESSSENKQSEGEASEGEMGHNVWVRSPVHNHYPSAIAPPPPPVADKQGVSPLLAALAAAALTYATIGAGTIGFFLSRISNPNPDVTSPDYSAGVTPGFGTPSDVDN